MPKPLPTPEELAAEALAGAKYRSLSPEMALRLAVKALKSGTPHAGAVQEVRSRMHQASASFLTARLRPQEAAQELHNAAAEGEGSLKNACLRLMAIHASTRERLPLLPDIYTHLFAGLPPPGSILDIGCGLHPLALPWMNLPVGVKYWAFDADSDQAALLDAFWPLVGVSGQAHTTDLLGEAPLPAADVALLLKLLPTLEQQEKGASLRLLQKIESPFLIVSFPTRSLGGRQIGMKNHYTAHFLPILELAGTIRERLDRPGELFFLLEKRH